MNEPQNRDDGIDDDLDAALPPLAGGDDEHDEAAADWPPEEDPVKPERPYETADFDAQRRRLCGARKRGTTERCRAPAMPNGRCRLHGGNAASGPAAGSWKHGRYSRLLPTGLTAAAEAIVNDPDRLDLSQQFGILEAMLHGALGDWTAGGGGPTWADVAAKWGEYRRARARGDVGAMAAALDAVERLIDAGYAAYHAREESRDIIERMRRVADTERKRFEAMQSTMTAAEVYALVGRLAAIVAEEVRDRAVIGRIHQRLVPMLGSRTDVVNGHRDGAGRGDGG
jgi:hypothetical protein